MTLEERIRRLEDIHEIHNLKAAYCNLCDGGWDRPPSANPEAIADLFTEDGVWDFGGTLPTVKGREQIILLMQSMQVMPLAFHNQGTASLYVDGDRAHGTWHGVNLLTVPDAGGQWSVGLYEDDYVRTDKGWKFSLVKFTRIFRTGFHTDWAEVMDLFQHPRLGEPFTIAEELTRTQA